MRKFLLVVLVLGVTAAIAHLLGTEAGRARREAMVARVRKTDGAGREPEIDLTETTGEEMDTKIAHEVGSASGTSG